ncbi:MAG: sugar ABC transporter permease [Clostridia bacterium]|nr:sugar ABC transporter permease [Clostridia bacterium]MBQ8962693.1 sugar ABC transporter permease [Clostridia bacterium]MBQ9039431.1 sugar ABC transporter permease [Clostridia bacterium]
MTSMTQNNKHHIHQENKGFFARLASQWQLALMSVPIFLYVILFNYVPMWGWTNAFKDYGNRKLVARGITPWNGLENFKWLFSRPDFYQAIRNTLAMSLINLVFGTVAAIVLAVLLNEVRQRAFKRTVQTVTYLPHFLSMVIIVAMAQNIFASNGPVNDLLKLLGLQPVFWLGEGKHFWWLVGIINVWKEVGWGTIIYISAMTSIDPSLYEAAGIDGAGRFQKILHVTLPGIKSTFVILLIMNIGHLMEAGFEIQYLLGNGLTADYSRTIDIFVLEYGTQQMDFGVATAAGIFKSVVAIILLVGANFISKKLGEDTLV